MHEGNPEILRLYSAAWISVCDSRVLTALARTVGLRLPTVSGVDLSEAVLDRVANEGDVVGVIGSSAQALDVVRARYPKITFHHYNPPMNFIHDSREVRTTLDFMRAHPVRFWLITIGSPQQERLAYLAAREDGISGVGFCVGNTINFLADPGSRAPMWMRRLALEWLYRLITEPRRLWRRYLVDDIRIVPVFLKGVLTGTAVRQPSDRFEGVRIPR
jgi:exopolysaccharide biosynthesis WecB/TagA/CpsF family protein